MRYGQENGGDDSMRQDHDPVKCALVVSLHSSVARALVL